MGSSASLAVGALWRVEHDDLADVQRLEDPLD